MTLDLACPDHGLEQRVTVIDLAAQRSWTEFFQGRHQARYACERELVTTVPVS